MSSDLALEVEMLGKRYDLQGRSRSLREALAAPVARLASRAGGESWWALRDVSFTVRRGERLAIIGRNGAGKSTLLRILARITSPTAGRAVVRGRFASLLEVGTGFHPELTGRENIRLNGAVLGMDRGEVAKRFDAIVAFADVGQFLDEPVKRYSTGMQMRLAFAVAAHLEPEIIAVDEVLAVGDAAFQRRCLGKMGEAAREGRTVLFVSHSMTTVAGLCARSLLLERGCVAADGPSAEVIGRYLGENTRGEATNAIAERVDRSGSGAIRFQSVSFSTMDGTPLTALRCGDDSRITLRFDRFQPGATAISIGIDNARGERIAHLSSAMSGAADSPADARIAMVELPALPLVPGVYRLTLFATIGGTIADWVQDAATLTVEGGDPFGSGLLPSDSQGSVLVGHAVRWGGP